MTDVDVLRASGRELGHGRAPGKVILMGEHAVVYGRPALAVPVGHVEASAVVIAAAPGAGLTIYARDLDERVVLRSASMSHPLAMAVRKVLAHLSLAEPDWQVVLTSSIPIASGMGSGAAVTTAIVRALAAAVDCTLAPDEISALVYEVEKLYHGTPSGVDNTVITYEQPVYFVRGHTPQPFAVGRPVRLVIADSGIASETRVAVGDVRHAWQQQPVRYEALFDMIGRLVDAGRDALAAGDTARLGALMNENHTALVELGVSCPMLDHLVTAARMSGAVGAKLSGAGRGGNMIALIADPDLEGGVANALRSAGASRLTFTTLGQTG